MGKISFSGHESFICKQFWLKKGVNFITNQDTSFTADDAVVHLGVGKNMVRSIRHWLRAFGIADDEDNITSIGRLIFEEDDGDPYIESIGTVWLLHYLLVTTGKATLYNIVFNYFRRLRPEFKTDHLRTYVKRYCDSEESNAFNPNTVDRDIRVLLNNYLPPSINKKSDLEDSFSGLLFELNLIEYRKKLDVIREEQVEYYSIEPSFRDSLPPDILLYSILDFQNGNRTATFRDLYNHPNSPGSVFALSQEGLYQKIRDILSKFPDLSYSETAGNRVLQIPIPFPTKSQILNGYYR